MRQCTLFLALTLAMLGFILVPSGCMMIAEKDLIRIAKVDNKYITRGDFFQLLREMEDDERPILRNKSDVLRVLNQHIDDLITLPLGDRLAAEGVIQVPREAAREQYFRSKGEQGEELRFMFNLDVNNAATMTELMNVYNLTPELLRARKDIIELKTDEILRRMQAEAAVGHMAVQDYQQGTLQLDEAAIQREYELRKEDFKAFEQLTFRAFRFPAAMPNALDQAAEVRRRLAEGTSWDDLEDEYLLRSPDLVVESEIENNPGLVKFSGFWATASGAQPGEVHGPVYLPEYQVFATDAQGRAQPVEMPAAYIVFRVLENYPERLLTLEEARNQLIPQILIAQEIRKLREDHGVEIYEDKLPDPGQYVQDDGGLA